MRSDCLALQLVERSKCRAEVARWRGDAGLLRTVTYDLTFVPCPMLRDEVAEADEGRGNETRAGRDLDQD